MNMYSKGPQQEAMQTLAHELNRGDHRIEQHAKKLRTWLAENKQAMIDAGISQSDALTALNFLDSGRVLVRKAYDDYYTAFNSFPDPANESPTNK